MAQKSMDSTRDSKVNAGLVNRAKREKCSIEMKNEKELDAPSILFDPIVAANFRLYRRRV